MEKSFFEPVKTKIVKKTDTKKMKNVQSGTFEFRFL